MKRYYILSTKFPGIEIGVGNDPFEAISNLEEDARLGQRAYTVHRLCSWDTPYRPTVGTYRNGVATAAGYFVVEIPEGWPSSIGVETSAYDIISLARRVRKGLQPDAFLELIDEQTLILATIYIDVIRIQMKALRAIKVFDVEAALKRFQASFSPYNSDKFCFDFSSSRSPDGELFRARGSNVDAVAVFSIERIVKMALAEAASEEACREVA